MRKRPPERRRTQAAAALLTTLSGASGARKAGIGKRTVCTTTMCPWDSEAYPILRRSLAVRLLRAAGWNRGMRDLSDARK